MRDLGAAVGSIRFLPAVLSCAFASALLSFGCRSPSTVPEDGAVLLRLAVPPGGPVPAELRIWVYDGAGVVFGNSRFPEQGTLPVPASGKSLGTILIQPGVVSGALRIHVRGFLADARVSDAVVVLAASTHDRATVDLVLSADVPPDDDGDGVPDAIDDCPARSNPAQGGCGALDAGDASADGPTVIDGGVEARDGNGDLGAPNDAGAGDAAQTDVRASDAAPVDAALADMTMVDVPAADAPNADVRPADVPAADMPAVDAPSSDVRPADVPAADVPAVDAPSSDARPADAAAADAGTDGPRKALGTSCAGAAECASGFCADGICCQTVCDQPCQRCLAGACLPVLRERDVPECAGAMTCNPTGKCVTAN